MKAPSQQLQRTQAVIQSGIAEGLHVGAQVYVSLAGKVAADFAMGEATTGNPMTTDSLMIWFSAGKPIGAFAIAQLWERGLLDLDDPVALHIPEFAVRGKDAITIRHLLTHTGGFRGVAWGMEDEPWDTIIHRVVESRLERNWTPGQTAGYHAMTSWFILGEIVHRLDPQNRSFDVFCRQEILEPAGMDASFFTITPEQYRDYGNRIGRMHVTSDCAPRPGYFLDSPEGFNHIRPGSGAHGPIRQLGWFYEMLLNRGTSPRTGQRILTPQTVEAITARHRVGAFDATFKVPIDWGLGFMVNSTKSDEHLPYGFGKHASPRTFGHGGMQSSAGFADPETGVAIAFLFNGTPGEVKHHQRRRDLIEAIYQDLGLAGHE